MTNKKKQDKDISTTGRFVNFAAQDERGKNNLLLSEIREMRRSGFDNWVLELLMVQ